MRRRILILLCLINHTVAQLCSDTDRINVLNMTFPATASSSSSFMVMPAKPDFRPIFPNLMTKWNPISKGTSTSPAKTSSSTCSSFCCSQNVACPKTKIQDRTGANIARGKKTSQSSTWSKYTSGLAVDGDTSTDFDQNSCSHTDLYDPKPAWWSVDLEEERILKKIIIFNRQYQTGRLKGANVKGYAANGSQFEISSSLQDYLKIEIDVKTLNPIRNVTITLPVSSTENILNICEVQVFENLNVARGKSTKQSSVYNDSSNSYVSDLAVDGNESSVFKDGSCTATAASTGAYTPMPETVSWSVNLGGEYLISYIKVFNRKDDETSTLNSRLGSFTVMATNEKNEAVILYHDESENPGREIDIPLYTKIAMPVTIISVRIPRRQNADNILTICEFEAYRAISCPLYRLENGRITVEKMGDNQRNYTYCATISLNCNQGYQLYPLGLQSRNSTCQSNGNWTTLAHCEAIMCPSPPKKPDNSELHSSEGIAGMWSYSSILNITCKQGYYLNGPSAIECAGDGQWNESNFGTCFAIMCPSPPKKPDNSELHSSEGIAGMWSYSSILNITCKQGYYLNGPSAIECAGDGQWNESNFGTCSVIVCPVPQLDQQRGIYTFYPSIDGIYSYNSRLSIKCKEGYQLNGANSINCTENGLWSGTIGTCEATRCKMPDVQLDKSLRFYWPGIEGNGTYNTTISVSCEVGYNLTGNEMVRCSHFGLWDGSLGYCSAIMCLSPPSIPSHSELEYKQGIAGNWSYHSSLSIRCNKGYRLSGSNSVQCMTTGLWNDSAFGFCSETQKYTESESSVAGTAGGVTAAICVVILGAVIAFIVYKRRTRGPGDKIVDTTLNEIPSSSDLKEQEENAILEKSIYAQPKKAKVQTKVSECDESKHVYINSNDSSKDYYSFVPRKVTDKYSLRVEDVASFFLSRKMEPSLYEEEYNKLPNGLLQSHEAALLPENKSKNRYKNMYPYDETRVKLEIWDPSNENDYINACYIHGFKTFHAYIAAQGPTKGILNDFWRMIWQTKCSKIVMLTNLTEEGKHKCEQYWPDDGSVEFGDIVIRLVQCETFSDFTIRTLEMRKTNGKPEGGTNETHQIKQFHFTAWPDRGVPRFASSLVHFRHKISATKTRRNTEGPMVVHCSAGVGRTGTFLALDYLVDQAEELGYINVVNCVETLRKQRVNLVQTVGQYIFLHEALVEALTCTTMALSTSEFQEGYRKLLERDNKTGKRKLDDEFEKLPMYVSNPGEDVYENAKRMDNRDKNRYSNILPDKNHCPFLNVYVKGRDSYINAVFLPAYKENNIFIITQMPLENTIVDLWRMVYQFEVSSIVMLNTLSEMKEEERYWTEDEKMLEIVPFRITLESKSSDDICTNFTMLLNYHDERRRVRLSRATYWADGKPVPKSPSAMLKHIDLIQNWQQETGNKPIIVHCMNGAERSGLFCVITALLERTKIEQDVAVEQIIKQMKSRRPQVIPNVDQYKFCYDAVLSYLDQFDTYSNFTGP